MKCFEGFMDALYRKKKIPDAVAFCEHLFLAGLLVEFGNDVSH